MLDYKLLHSLLGHILDPDVNCLDRDDLQTTVNGMLERHARQKEYNLPNNTELSLAEETIILDGEIKVPSCGNQPIKFPMAFVATLLASRTGITFEEAITKVITNIS